MLRKITIVVIVLTVMVGFESVFAEEAGLRPAKKAGYRGQGQSVQTQMDKWTEQLTEAFENNDREQMGGIINKMKQRKNARQQRTTQQPRRKMKKDFTGEGQGRQHRGMRQREQQRQGRGMQRQEGQGRGKGFSQDRQQGRQRGHMEQRYQSRQGRGMGQGLRGGDGFGRQRRGMGRCSRDWQGQSRGYGFSGRGFRQQNFPERQNPKLRSEWDW